MKTQFDRKTWRTWPNPELTEKTRFTREYVVRQIWQIIVDDKFDLENAIQTNAEFSYAMRVIDEIGRWEEACGSTPRLLFATVKKTCNNTGSSSSDHWRQRLGCAMMPSRPRKRLINSPSLVRKQRFLETLDFDMEVPMCGAVGHILVLVADKCQSEICGKLFDSGRNTMKQSIWLFKALSCWPSEDEYTKILLLEVSTRCSRADHPGRERDANREMRGWGVLCFWSLMESVMPVGCRWMNTGENLRTGWHPSSQAKWESLCLTILVSLQFEGWSQEARKSWEFLKELCRKGM